MKGGVIIPNINFITSLLNITPEDVSKCTVKTLDDTVFYSITLKRVTNFPRFRKRVMYALSPDIFYALKSTLTSDKRPGKKRGRYNTSQFE